MKMTKSILPVFFATIAAAVAQDTVVQPTAHGRAVVTGGRTVVTPGPGESGTLTLSATASAVPGEVIHLNDARTLADGTVVTGSGESGVLTLTAESFPPGSGSATPIRPVDGGGAGGTLAFNSSDGRTLILRQQAGPITYLGLSTSPVPDNLASQLSLARDTGLVVETVAEGSAAAKAGIQKDDVLVKLDEQILIDTHQFTVLIRNRKEGDRVKVSLIRNAKPMEVTVELGKTEGTTVESGGVLHLNATPAPTFSRSVEIDSKAIALERLKQLIEQRNSEKSQQAPQAVPATQASDELKNAQEELKQIRRMLEELSRKVDEKK